MYRVISTVLLVAKTDWTTVASKDNSSHWFYFSSAADEEHQQDVAAAVRPQPYAEERGDGMPRRRRNLGNRMMAQRRAQQAEEWVEGNAWCSSASRH